MIDQDKREIRKKIKELKKKYTLAQKKDKSRLIFDKLLNNSVFQKSEYILAYWSMDDEVFTHDFILDWYKKKKIILPVVNGDELSLRFFSGIQDMKKGQSFGILEPVGMEFKEIEKLDLIIVPGVAFDNQKNRLGRGKAYYDKLLQKTKAFKVGVCFDFQLIDSVPVGEHDVKMDAVIFD